MKVLLIDTLHPIFAEMLTNKGYSCVDGSKLTLEEVLSILPQYEGIAIRSRFKVDEAFINAGVNLKFIARAGAGLENIDKKYAAEKAVAVINSPEGNRDAVAEQAVGMLLNLLNNITAADAEVRKGVWQRVSNRGVELGGKTIALIGYGNTGAAFAQRLKGFAVNILAYDKYKKDFGNEYVQEATIDDIFEQADILSLHIPLADDTQYLVNDAYIKRFKKPIYVINTARGKAINTADLVKNMKEGKVLGACLDVLEYESHTFEQFQLHEMPEAFQYLASSNKVVLTPHIAGWTNESNEKIARFLAEKIIAKFKN